MPAGVSATLRSQQMKARANEVRRAAERQAGMTARAERARLRNAHRLARVAERERAHRAPPAAGTAGSRP
jgi:hypothetical protein